jgi:hypothetical protein
LLSFYSPLENTGSSWVKTWSFWCILIMPTFRIAFKQTTIFVARLLIISSPIHSNLAVTWLID